MQPRREIEIKLRVENPRQLKRRLKELNFTRATPRVLEKNSLFDFHDGRLARGRQVVRIRSAGGRVTLTFKGPPSLAGGHKSRDEIETTAGDEPALRGILQRIGMREAFAYDKYRTEYSPPGKAGRGKSLVYDETPVGDFIELEGPAAWIDRVAAQLGYQRESYITQSYRWLYLQGRGRDALSRERVLQRNQGQPRRAVKVSPTSAAKL